MLELATHGIQYLRVAVAEDHRAPGADVVDVALVVLVDDIGASACLRNSGVPPTLRKARTGELTPPGMWVWALAGFQERDAGLAKQGGRR